MLNRQYFEYVLGLLKTWMQAFSNPEQFLAPGFQPTDNQVVSGMEFYAVLVIVSVLLGAPLVVAQKGDLADKTRLAANGVFGVLSISLVALTWHISFWVLGGQSNFAGTFLAYVYGAGPYIPLTGLATWIVASAFPKHLLVYWVNPTMAQEGMRRAKDDPGTSTGMVALGCLFTSGIMLWSFIVVMRCFSYAHALSGWRLVGAILLSVVIAIPVGAVMKRMGTMLQREEEGAKTLTRRIIEEMWNKGNLEVANESFAENSLVHDPTIPNAKPGPEGVKEFVRLYRAAFPDLHMDIDDQMGEGDLVVTRWTLTGTQEGALGEIPAAGKWVSVKGITIYRFHKGEVAEGWMNWDALGLLQQLGLDREGTDESTRQMTEHRGGTEPELTPA